MGDPVKFGPGTLKIGPTETTLDISCLINSATISSDNDTGDSRTMLCGTVRAGSITFTYSISGNVDTDVAQADGLFALSQSAKGQVLPFTFEPQNGVTTASGNLRITPLDFGGEDFGEDMNSDFEWEIIGEPTYEYPAAAGGASAPSPDWWQALVTPDSDIKSGPVGPTPLNPGTGTGSGSSAGSTSDSSSSSDSTSESVSDSTSDSVSDSSSDSTSESLADSEAA